MTCEGQCENMDGRYLALNRLVGHLAFGRGHINVAICSYDVEWVFIYHLDIEYMQPFRSLFFDFGCIYAYKIMTNANRKSCPLNL